MTRGVVFIPSPQQPVMVSAAIINSDLSAEHVGAFAALMWWSEQGQKVSADRLADRFGWPQEHAVTVFEDLFQVGAIARVTPPVDEPAPVRPRKLKLVHTPNLPEGRRSGRWPLQDGDTVPPVRISVVYFLQGETGDLLYIGSTGDFRGRMKAHQGMKSWSTWNAWPCKTRDAAYRLEGELILKHRPPLNKHMKVPVPGVAR